VLQVRLIHWNEKEAEERAERLRALGYDVTPDAHANNSLKEIREHPPAAFVIDLTRLPSHGREIGMALRQYKATRLVPLVFVEGDPDKVARIKQHLPDAVYTSWNRIASALKRAIERPPKAPVVPATRMDAYSGTPLPKKLGIKPQSVLALINAPAGFSKTLALPPDVTVRTQTRGRSDLIVWFVTSAKAYESGLARITKILAERGSLWIAWPKKTSGQNSDLSETIIRRIGLASGLVDYKVCAIDSTWSGLCFIRRKGNK
jgi:hypothetical protein